MPKVLALPCFPHVFHFPKILISPLLFGGKKSTLDLKKAYFSTLNFLSLFMLSKLQTSIWTRPTRYIIEVCFRHIFIFLLKFNVFV